MKNQIGALTRCEDVVLFVVALKLRHWHRVYCFSGGEKDGLLLLQLVHSRASKMKETHCLPDVDPLWVEWCPSIRWHEAGQCDVDVCCQSLDV